MNVLEICGGFNKCLAATSRTFRGISLALPPQSRAPQLILTWDYNQQWNEASVEMEMGTGGSKKEQTQKVLSREYDSHTSYAMLLRD